MVAVVVAVVAAAAAAAAAAAVVVAVVAAAAAAAAAGLPWQPCCFNSGLRWAIAPVRLRGLTPTPSEPCSSSVRGSAARSHRVHRS